MRQRGKPGRPMAAARELLAVSLEFAVPAAISELAAMPPECREVIAACWAELLASHGDALVVVASRSQEEYSALADGLAVLAFRPGGVEFCGRRWQASVTREGA